MLHPFSELHSLDFYLTHFSMAKSTKIIKHFVCTKNMHNSDRFMLITKGEFNIKKSDNSVIYAKEGDLLYFPEGCTYIGDWQSDEIEYYITQFRLSDDEGKFVLSENICKVLNDKENTILDLFKKINFEWINGEPSYKIKVHSLFLELLHYISQKVYKRNIRHTQPDISTAIIYIENNYMNDFSVAELAKMCQMCESKFRMRFHSYAGMPPISYRNFLRVKKAAEILSDGEYNVFETAELCGFSDVSYFNRVFKQFLKRNPCEYKKN